MTVTLDGFSRSCSDLSQRTTRWIGRNRQTLQSSLAEPQKILDQMEREQIKPINLQTFVTVMDSLQEPAGASLTDGLSNRVRLE